VRPLNEQIVLLTGATDGLGRHVARALAAAGATVILHGRNADKLDDVQRELGARHPTVLADLADLRQVDRLAGEIVDGYDRVDVLVNNAGVGFGRPDSGRALSRDGYELRFAVNYLAGYRLTRRLLPLLTSSAPARIVHVASAGQEALDFDDPQSERSYNGIVAYRRSKLAQIMFTIDFADEVRDVGVTVNALHPASFMDTPMVREYGGQPMSTVEEGSAATVRLITDPSLDGVTGRYFDGQREARPHRQAFDAGVRARLRKLSDDLIAAALTRS
jgi:NAD(P)-dependent dehydrogenase (short-subunit alcohol dehydrogenase family)